MQYKINKDILRFTVLRKYYPEIFETKRNKQ